MKNNFIIHDKKGNIHIINLDMCSYIWIEYESKLIRFSDSNSNDRFDFRELDFEPVKERILRRFEIKKGIKYGDNE